MRFFVTDLYYKSKVSGNYVLAITSDDVTTSLIIGDDNASSPVASVQIRSNQTIFGTTGGTYSFTIGSGIVEAYNYNFGNRYLPLNHIYANYLTVVEDSSTYAKLYVIGGNLYCDVKDGGATRSVQLA